MLERNLASTNDVDNNGIHFDNKYLIKTNSINIWEFWKLLIYVLQNQVRESTPAKYIKQV